MLKIVILVKKLQKFKFIQSGRKYLKNHYMARNEYLRSRTTLLNFVPQKSLTACISATQKFDEKCF